MNKLNPERRHNNAKRASIGAALAGIATGVVLFGPAPNTMADLIHQTRGNDNTVERAIERIAAETYDTTIFVHCAPTKAPLLQGQTSLLYHTVRLKPSVCATLGGIIANPEAADPRNDDNVIAILATAHELSHVNGAGLHKKYDEGVTQCLGVQRSEEVAKALGIPAENARIIGDVAAVVANIPDDPEYVIPSGCVDGGPYDIHAAGGHFPKDPIEAYINGD